VITGKIGQKSADKYNACGDKQLWCFPTKQANATVALNAIGTNQHTLMLLQHNAHVPILQLCPVVQEAG
jgi:hypothetical protein